MQMCGISILIIPVHMLNDHVYQMGKNRRINILSLTIK